MYIGFGDVRQTEIHTVVPQVPESSTFESEMAIEGLNRHKSPGIDQIPAEVVTAGSRTFPSEIHKLIHFIWNKEELPQEWKKSIITSIYNKCDKTNYCNYSGISLCQPCTKLYPTSCYCYITADSLQSRGSKNFGAGSTLGIFFFFILWPTIT